MHELFRIISTHISNAVGSPWGFILALLFVLSWALSGYFFNYSDTWQLFINTGTTIMTFLIVFLIQNTQNRDTKATHLKLDELIRAQSGTRDTVMDAEELSDEEIERLHKDYKRIHERYEKELAKRKSKKKA